LKASTLAMSGFFEPVFYLVSIRLGLGTLVGDVQVGGTTVSYAEFVAPALLATSAMNGAIYDSTMNVFFKLKYAHIYDAVLATPMGVGDVAVGEIGWALIRGAIYATGFLTVMVAMGLTGSVWAIACLPAALLIGFAFAAVDLAGCSFARTWSDFTWVETITVPLFLFSTHLLPAVGLLARRGGSCGRRRSTTGWRCAEPSRRASCPGRSWPTPRTCWSWASSGCS
jgi:lipooligosaccharide transport system permease protein